MAKYKYKESGDTIEVKEGDKIVAKYEIDYHWQEKNVSIKDSNTLSIRLYNRMKGYIDCDIKLNVDDIQKIPDKL